MAPPDPQSQKVLTFLLLDTSLIYTSTSFSKGLVLTYTLVFLLFVP